MWAEASFAHRTLYLDYEGPVSGGRGRVRRWDDGDYELLTEGPGRMEFLLRGTRLKGRCRLEEASDGAWRLSYTPDEG